MFGGCRLLLVLFVLLCVGLLRCSWEWLGLRFWFSFVLDFISVYCYWWFELFYLCGIGCVDVVLIM